MPFKPIDAARACIRRSERFLKLAEQTLPDSRVKNDLRRNAIVMCVAGIDAYMHWLVYHRISELRTAGDIPKALEKLNIPFTELVALADMTTTARANGVASRPWVRVKHVMQNRLLLVTLQSFDQVATAFAWAGIANGWRETAKEMGEPVTEIKKRLNSLVHRRNQIVHEGDILRAARPRALTYNDIKHEAVVRDVAWVSALLTAVQRAVDAAP